ncbi:membrane peptidoglycan carboxypeptidase [Streptomyces sp. 2333.5]|uniref:transglycosylase domain-containing protein n=1 Tax=unclassified Streptomyces TaxID=2593676 RepID=UPI000897AED7|nr:MULTISPECIES: transglycosylase domain-containing protein [unclassified Streptomyces]PJJ03443.1 membrane peptidoglycan carboxypeptidase [Streptomyces sp. 2333.5]SED40461.1 Membrane carboxypeptidase (penicillin-binding protein) [Streptomyces sp. 2314.4]SEE45721.1 Membrane carboxypeptidase (penicillin-binding protein) [Streptomyces sp. 2112.2]
MPKKRDGGGLSKTQQAAKFLGVSVLAGAVLAGLALPAAGALGLTAKGSVEGFDDIPTNLKTPPLSQRTRILDAKGGEIAKVYSRDRTVVGLKDMSPYIQKAIVAIEDARFYEHGAVDLKGILRAVNKNAQSGGVSQGASTLTQQYVKNVFVEEAGDDPDKVAQATQQTIGRKIKELKYAIQVEKELGKQKILQNYLNITFFGQQAYGIEAAAQRYFSKHAKDLNLQESALLAGLVQSPSRYDPVNDPQEATRRRNTVLQRMADLKDVTQAQADAAAKKPIKLAVSRPKNGCITATDGAGFFCDYIRKVFLGDRSFGKTRKIRAQRWNEGGMTIRTTLDPQTQKSIQASLGDHVYDDDPVAGAATIVEPGSGRILGMGQSRPYGFGENQTVINLSVDHRMGGGAGYQPGSTFKPVIAAAALEQGTSPEQEYPSPYRMPYPSPVQTCDGEWQGTDSTQNENKEEVGPYAMKEATAKSVNTYFVQLISDIGICPAVNMAQKMGIERADGKPLQQVPSMTLGVQEMSPLTMASGYAAFANGGEYCSPVAIESITDARGRSLKVPQTSCRSAMSKKTADTINTLLKGVVEDGTGREAGLRGRDSAGKTGTSDSRYAAWFVGYTPNAAGAVWVGDPQHKRKMYDITIGGVPHDKVYGADTPGPIWRDAMTGALDGRPAPALPTVPIDDPAKDKSPGDEGDKGPAKHKPGRGGHGKKPGGGWSIPGFPDILGGGNGG